MDGNSLDITKEKINRLKDMFPEAVTEGKIDWDVLRLALGDGIATGQERYGLGWPGKAEAFQTIQEQTTATLVPVREESIDFDETEHVFIEGENLEVLKVLQKAYFGKVKVIEIDGPYNTGNDSFVYPDNFSERKEAYLKRINEMDDNGYLNKDDLFRKNAKESGHFHSNWLGMMYPRLYLARNLLREDGVIFVHIDDHEVHNLRHLMDEIFGAENFIGMFVWQSKKGGGSDSGTVVTDQEYVLSYGKSAMNNLSRILIEAEPLDREDEKGTYRRGRELNKWGSGSRREDRPTMYFPIPGPKGAEVYPIRNDGAEGRWRWGKKKMSAIVERGDVEFIQRSDGTYIAYEKVRSQDQRLIPYRTFLPNVGTTADGSKTVKELFDGKKVFDFPKPVELVKQIITMGANSDDELILDFFGGACSTAHAVLDLNREDGGNRHFIMIQLPEKTDEDSEAFKAGYKTIADIGKERIRRVIARLKKEREGALPLAGKPDLGFKVFKLRPSNFRMWRSDILSSEQLMNQLEMSLDPVKPQTERENQLWEILLKAGYPLTVNVEEKELGGHPVHIVEEGKLVIALSGVNPETIDAIIRIKPLAFICLDSLFGGNDPLKTNTALQLKDAGIDFKSL